MESLQLAVKRKRLVEISFTASGKWTPSLQYSTGSDWAAITNTSGNSAAGKGGFRVKVDKNEAGQERILTVLVQVEGYKTPEVVCTITQSGSGDVSSADIALNEFMHNYLKEHYLFKDEYNTLEVVFIQSYPIHSNNYITAS